MRKKGVQRGISLFLTYLIIALPVFSTSILAQSNDLDRERSHSMGNDGVVNLDDRVYYFRPGSSERITLNIVASHETEAVTLDDVGIDLTIGGADYKRTFNYGGEFCNLYGSPSCTELEGETYLSLNAYNCTCVEYFGDDPFTYKFFFKAPDMRTPLKTFNRDVVPDVLPPEVSVYDMPVQEADEVILSFTVQDKACDDPDYGICSTPTTCAGIGDIAIFDNGALVHTESLDTVKCKKTLERLAVPGLSGDGTHSICVEARDRMHEGPGDSLHASELECQEVDLDFSNPEVCPGGVFKIMRGGQEVTYVSPDSPNADFIGQVVFTVEDHSLTHVMVNASELYPGTRGRSYQEIEWPGSGNPSLTCTEQGETGVHECIIDNIRIRPAVGDPMIVINATDSQGLHTSATCSASMTLDNDMPQSVFLGTDNCDIDGQCYLHPGTNVIISRIVDAGSGMAEAYVYFRLGEVNSGYGSRVVRARACTDDDSDGTWDCFREVPADAGISHEKRVSIFLSTGGGYPSMDSAYNPVEGIAEAELIMDREEPKAAKELLRAEDANSGEPFLISGGDGRIYLFVNDSGSGVQTATGDFSKIKPGAGSVEGACEEAPTTTINHEYVCMFDVSGLGAPKTDARVVFNITDFAGNTKNNVRGEVNVSGTDEEEISFWYVDPRDVEMSPAALSRKHLQMADFRVYAYSVFSEMSSGRDAEVVAFDSAVLCEPQQTLQLLDMRSPKLMNTKNRQEPKPILLFEIPTQTGDMMSELEYPAITLNCTVGVITKWKNTIYPREEIVIPIEIDLMDAPFGDLTENVKEELRRIKASTTGGGKGFASTILKLEGTMHFIEKMCQVLAGIGALAGVLNTVAGLLLGAEKVWPFLEEAATTMSKVSAGSYFGQENWAKWAAFPCSIASCTLMKYAGATMGDMVEEIAKPGTSIESGEIRDQERTAAYASVPDAWQEIAYKNPRESLVGSMLTLCLPGIISNLQKAKQIECRYAACLRFDVPQGENVVTCTTQRTMDWCIYVEQQGALQWPFMGFLNHYIFDVGAEVFRNPLTLGVSAVSTACGGVHKKVTIERWPLLKHLCVVPKLAESMKTYLDFQNNIGKGWKPQKDYCESVFEGFDE
ncbi:MAG: hypothetical protein ABIC95_02720 [archaeon]